MCRYVSLTAGTSFAYGITWLLKSEVKDGNNVRLDLGRSRIDVFTGVQLELKTEKQEFHRRDDRNYIHWNNFEIILSSINGCSREASISR